MTLLSNEIEKFFNLIKVDTNPATFSIREVFKKNNKVESSIREEIYNLEKYQLDITDISSIKTMYSLLKSKIDQEMNGTQYWFYALCFALVFLLIEVGLIIWLK
jgi:predicted Mrr-cat superfamily restriction endonuclease